MRRRDVSANDISIEESPFASQWPSVDAEPNGQGQGIVQLQGSILSALIAKSSAPAGNAMARTRTRVRTHAVFPCHQAFIKPPQKSTSPEARFDGLFVLGYTVHITVVL